jgi:Flp pilus assembly protein TadD
LHYWVELKPSRRYILRANGFEPPAYAIVKPLEPPDSHHLSSAQGWLGLGNWREARDDIQRIAPELRAHPDVLEVTREIFAQAGKWDMAAETAGAVATLKPQEPQAWIALAYAIRRKTGGGLEAAKNILAKAQKEFPKEPLIAYNLACYECQLGNKTAATQWLQNAFATGPAKQLRSMALDDRDLEPLWPQIREGRNS